MAKKSKSKKYRKSIKYLKINVNVWQPFEIFLYNAKLFFTCQLTECVTMLLVDHLPKQNLVHSNAFFEKIEAIKSDFMMIEPQEDVNYSLLKIIIGILFFTFSQYVSLFRTLDIFFTFDLLCLLYQISPFLGVCEGTHP